MNRWWLALSFMALALPAHAGQGRAVLLVGQHRVPTDTLIWIELSPLNDDHLRYPRVLDAVLADPADQPIPLTTVALVPTSPGSGDSVGRVWVLRPRRALEPDTTYRVLLRPAINLPDFAVAAQMHQPEPARPAQAADIQLGTLTTRAEGGPPPRWTRSVVKGGYLTFNQGAKAWFTIPPSAYRHDGSDVFVAVVPEGLPFAWSRVVTIISVARKSDDLRWPTLRGLLLAGNSLLVPEDIAPDGRYRHRLVLIGADGHTSEAAALDLKRIPAHQRPASLRPRGPAVSCRHCLEPDF